MPIKKINLKRKNIEKALKGLREIAENGGNLFDDRFNILDDVFQRNVFYLEEIGIDVLEYRRKYDEIINFKKNF